MHPAVKAHINGNLSIIRSCIAQIEAAIAADDLGHHSAEAIGQQRKEREKDGQASPYLDEEQEKMLQEGLGEFWTQAKEEINETITTEPSVELPKEQAPLS